MVTGKQSFTKCWGMWWKYFIAMNQVPARSFKEA
jgi:hypothetical protein